MTTTAVVIQQTQLDEVSGGCAIGYGGSDAWRIAGLAIQRNRHSHWSQLLFFKSGEGSTGLLAPPSVLRKDGDCARRTIYLRKG